MKHVLKITGYVGHDADVVESAIAADANLILAPLDKALRRADELTGEPTDREIGLDQGRIIAEASELDGATLSIEPVGDGSLGLTALTLVLSEPFVSGERGRREFLAASLLMGGSADAIEDRLAA